MKQRIGQDIFRRALDNYWEGRCAVTGVAQRELLRASHIVPWAECRSDAERLDAENGLLLCANWDAAFDAGLVSFDDEGGAIGKAALDPRARAVLGIEGVRLQRLNDRVREQLAWHRGRFGSDGEMTRFVVHRSPAFPARGLLIADDVGIGIMIEAGLI